MSLTRRYGDIHQSALDMKVEYKKSDYAPQVRCKDLAPHNIYMRQITNSNKVVHGTTNVFNILVNVRNTERMRMTK